MNTIGSELLKYKRTFTRKIILSFPLFFAIQAMAGVKLMPKDIVRNWDLVTSMVFNIWTVVFLPFGMALFAFLADAQERKAGNYRSLRTHQTSAINIWVGKITVMAFHTLLSCIVLSFSILISGIITAKGTIPYIQIFEATFVSWLVSLALIPIQLFAATYKGLFLSMAVGFIGFIAGIVSAAGSYWVFIPWAWGIRLMCAIIGVHPNGTLLEQGSNLRDMSVIPTGIVISLSVFIIITIITAFWFKRREVK